MPAARSRSLIACVSAMAVTAALAGPAQAGPDRVRLSPDWRKYVAAPSSREVAPIRVLTSTGGVTDPGDGTR